MARFVSQVFEVRKDGALVIWHGLALLLLDLLLPRHVLERLFLRGQETDPTKNLPEHSLRERLDGKKATPVVWQHELLLHYLHLALLELGVGSHLLELLEPLELLLKVLLQVLDEALLLVERIVRQDDSAHSGEHLNLSA